MGVKETHDLTTSASISRFLVVCLVLLRYNIEVQVSKAPACGSFWKLIYEGNFLYHQIPYPLKIQDSHDVFPKKNRTQKRTHLTDPMGGWINYAEPSLSHQKRMDWLVFCQVHTMSQPFSVLNLLKKYGNKSYGGVTFSKSPSISSGTFKGVWRVKLTPSNGGEFFGASKKAASHRCREGMSWASRWPWQIRWGDPGYGAHFFCSNWKKWWFFPPERGSPGSIIDTTWWFCSHFLCSPRNLGKWSNLTSIFFKWVETTN